MRSRQFGAELLAGHVAKGEPRELTYGIWKRGNHYAIRILGVGKSAWWQVYCSCGVPVPFRTREEMGQRLARHFANPVEVRMRPKRGEKGGNSPEEVPRCSFCEQREAAIGPAYRRKSDPLYGTTRLLHGWVCESCYVMTGFVRLTCPIRRSDDPKALMKKAERGREKASRQRRIQGFAVRSLRILEGGFVDVKAIVRDHSRTGPHVGVSDRQFLWEMVMPERAEIESGLRSLIHTYGPAARLTEAEVKKNERQATQSQDITFGLDNPFEDPEFYDRLLAIGRDEAGKSGR
jgi:hypothetical protein